MLPIHHTVATILQWLLVDGGWPKGKELITLLAQDIGETDRFEVLFGTLGKHLGSFWLNGERNNGCTIDIII